MKSHYYRLIRSSRLVAVFLLLGCLMAAGHSYAQQIGALLWEENFNSLDPALWNAIEGDGCPSLCGWGNQELEYYRPDNVSIEAIPGEAGNSALVLEARQQAAQNRAFTSGKVDSEGKVAIHYGMIETRLRVPNLDTGLWPAFWLLGTGTATWPASGEIDMMEMGHRRADIDEFYPGTPLNNYVGSNAIFYSEDACVPENPTCAASTAWQTDNAYAANAPLSDRFVIYRLYWTDQSLRFTIVDNGVEYDMYDEPIPITDESAEFREPFYLITNLAVGGNFTDAMQNSDVTAPLPAKMYIDYIRVYELDGQGEVTLGSLSEPETGTFGVFTDNTPTNNKLKAGETSDIYVWSTDSLSAGNETPYEGSEVISWDYTAPGQWFGGGVQARQARDMSNFSDGALTFRIKVPPSVSFRIGITDTYTNEHYVDFPAYQDQYGLVRSGSGDWSQVTIPVADLRGPLVALQSLQYLFAIVSDDPLPANNVSIAIDDIIWVGGDQDNGDNDDVPPTEPSGPFGALQVGADEVEFYVNTNGWADVHYQLNGGTQQNLRMTQQNGQNVYRVSGLSAGDQLNYSFTYWDPANQYAVGTEWETVTLH